MTRPIAVDLFSGAGGMSLGFEQAGFDVVAAIEVDPIHAAVHKFNFPNCATICNDVSKLSGNEIRRRAEIGHRAVDVVFGGAPCQGFSLMGQRALDDPRNKLVSEFVRIVCELNARYFVFENVKGLTLGKHKQFLEELVSTFEERGYVVRKPWLVLNASDYGVPQNRQRLILMGARKGIQLPRYPQELGVKPTVGDAIADLPNADEFEQLLEQDSVLLPANAWEQPSSYAAELRGLAKNSWHFGYVRDWNKQLLTSSIRTIHTDISRSRFAETIGGKVEPISRFFKLPENGLSNTLRAGTDAARGAFTSPRPIHFNHPRCITVREMARLHGFPDWFRFHATKWHGAREIGNAVPPPLARAVASSIISGMGLKPTRPKQRIKLGDPALLSIDMREASRFWDVMRPIGKRDRKSGLKKRSQHETEIARLATGTK